VTEGVGDLVLVGLGGLDEDESVMVTVGVGERLMLPLSVIDIRLLTDRDSTPLRVFGFVSVSEALERVVVRVRRLKVGERVQDLVGVGYVTD
jgi:uncharacterized protein YjfI (DUF2170 family)